jgi:hypothetical protein
MAVAENLLAGHALRIGTIRAPIQEQRPDALVLPQGVFEDSQFSPYRKYQLRTERTMTNQSTMLQGGPAADGETRPEESPFVTEFVMVQSLGFRGMAYCGRDGKWRDAFSHHPLLGRIYILE